MKNKSDHIKTAILCPTLSFAGAIKNQVRKEADSKYNTFKLLDTFEICQFPNFFLTSGHIGSSATILLANTLHNRFGVENFILFGSSGSVDDRLKIGQIITPKSYSTDENYPINFGAETEGEVISSNLQKKLSYSLKPTKTHIWTTGLPMLESQEKAKEYCKGQVSAIDMEFASLYSYCEFKGLELAAIFIVSDILGGATGFKNKEFRQAREIVARSLCKDMTESIPKLVGS